MFSNNDILELGNMVNVYLLILPGELKSAGIGEITFHFFSPKHLEICLAHYKLLNK